MLEQHPALRTVATAFLRKRPLVVAPMMIALVATSIASGAPHAQILAIAGFAATALAFFGWEAWRGRRALVTPGSLLASLITTLIGIGAVAFVSGGASSPLILMAFAPTAIGFAAFGRGRASDVLLIAAVVLLVALATLGQTLPFDPLDERARRWLIAVCGADALLLLRIGVSALTDAHAAAQRAAEGAIEDAEAARGAAIEAMGAKVAHEVRNPLSAIRGLVEVIAERADERDRQRMSVVIGEVDRIDTILTGYLELARPLVQVEPRDWNIGALVRDITALVEARAEQAGVIVRVDAVDAVARVDPRRIKEAILNLVLNAIDATPRGGQVILRCAISGADVIVAIEDTGKGIDKERLTELGKPFSTGREGGTGLGFLLARTAIERHGAVLELSSVPGKTVAQFRLQVRP